jgi:hypothetical protein
MIKHGGSPLALSVAVDGLCGVSTQLTVHETREDQSSTPNGLEASGVPGVTARRADAWPSTLVWCSPGGITR